MNEEMKIIIKAVTDSAKKEIGKVRQEIENLNKKAKAAGAKISETMKSIAKGTAIAVGAITAVGAALVTLGKNTLQFQQEQARLNAAFQAAGASAEQAAESYNGLYRFLGDSGKASEAAAHLAKITTNQQDLAEWTKIAQGVYATFGDSLPIEGLTEAANETLRVGQVTGTLADALNWAGVSEDDFNAKLAQTSSLEEREALLRSTLNGLYSEAAEIYERNNSALLAYNESQARLDTAMAAAGAATMPLLTALNNLGSAFFTALKPALDVIIPPIVTFVNWIAKAIQAVTSFFSALTGKSTTVKAVGEIGKGMASAATGAQKLGTGMKGAEKAAGKAAEAVEEAKKSTQGFDELNIVSSGKSASGGAGGSGGSGGGGSSSPGYAGGLGGIDAATFSTETQEIEESTNSLAERIKSAFADIDFTNLKTALDELKTSLEPFTENLGAGLLWLIENVLAPLAAWTIEDVLPAFLGILSGAIDVLNQAIEDLKPIFQWFWDNVLAPIASWTGGVIVDVLNGIGDALKWIADNEIAMTILESIAIAIGLVAAAIGIYNGVMAVCNVVTGIFSGIMAVLTSPITLVVAAIAAVVAVVLLCIKYWDEIGAAAQAAWDWICQTWETVATWFSENVVTPVKDFFTGIWDKIVEVFGAIKEWFSTKFTEAKEAIELAWATVGQFFTDIWAKICEVFATIKEWFSTKFTEAWTAICEVFASVKTWFEENVWNKICEVFATIKTWFENKFQEAWDAVCKVFATVKTWFEENVWNKITEVFSAAHTWFDTKFTEAWTKIKDVFAGVKTWFEENVWNKITGVFDTAQTWFEDKFKDAFQKIKDVFTGPNGIKAFFEGLWTDIKTAFTTLGTNIGSAIGDSVKSGINGVISLIETTINKAIGLINGGIDLINKIPGVNVGKVSKLTLPRLARGGIVDDATIAMIGEQGKEAVVPLENNTQWMDKLAERLAARSQNPTKVILKVGEKELGWATIGAINGITEQTGGLQLVL